MWLLLVSLRYTPYPRNDAERSKMTNVSCEQFLGKQESEIQHIALVTLEGHQRAIMGSMTVEVST
jgi:hypothetical protein